MNCFKKDELVSRIFRGKFTSTSLPCLLCVCRWHFKLFHFFFPSLLIALKDCTCAKRLWWHFLRWDSEELWRMTFKDDFPSLSACNCIVQMNYFELILTEKKQNPVLKEDSGWHLSPTGISLRKLHLTGCFLYSTSLCELGGCPAFRTAILKLRK